MAIGEARKAIFWPSPCSKDESFDSSGVLSRDNLDFCVWDGSQGVINFPWIFYAMRSSVPVGHFRNISRHLFTWLVCGSDQWRHGLLFTDCIVWQGLNDWFWNITLDPLRMMEYRVSKASTVSIITAVTHHQLSIDIFFSLLSMKYDIKIQNEAIWRFLR